MLLLSESAAATCILFLLSVKGHGGVAMEFLSQWSRVVGIQSGMVIGLGSHDPNIFKWRVGEVI